MGKWWVCLFVWGVGGWIVCDICVKVGLGLGLGLSRGGRSQSFGVKSSRNFFVFSYLPGFLVNAARNAHVHHLRISSSPFPSPQTDGWMRFCVLKTSSFCSTNHSSLTTTCYPFPPQTYHDAIPPTQSPYLTVPKTPERFTPRLDRWKSRILSTGLKHRFEVL